MYARKEEAIAVEKKIEEKIKESPPLLKSFYNSIMTKSYTTKKNYINKLLDYFKFLEMERNIPEITDEIILSTTTEDVNNYIVYITKRKNPEKDYTKTYLANQISALNSFYNYLVRRKLISENPLDTADNKPTVPTWDDNNSVIFLTDEEKAILFHNILQGVGSSQGKARQRKCRSRDMLLVMLPLLTGVRVSALVNINVQDLDLERHVLRVYEKGFDRSGKPKELMLSNEAIGFTKSWLEERANIPGIEQTDALFVSNYGNEVKRLTTSAVRKIVSKFTEGIDKHITPHKLRSTFATDYYNMTHDIYSTAVAMGHTNVQVTRHYAAVTKEKQLENMNELAKKTTSFI